MNEKKKLTVLMGTWEFDGLYSPGATGNTGGLGIAMREYVDQLLKEYKGVIDARIVIPYHKWDRSYPNISPENRAQINLPDDGIEREIPFEIDMGPDVMRRREGTKVSGTIKVCKIKTSPDAPEITAYLVDCDEYFKMTQEKQNRNQLQLGSQSAYSDGFDKTEEASFLSRAFVEIIKRGECVPDVAHLCDFHFGTVPLQLKVNGYDDIGTFEELHNPKFKGAYVPNAYQKRSQPEKSQEVRTEEVKQKIKEIMESPQKIEEFARDFTKRVGDLAKEEALEDILKDPVRKEELAKQIFINFNGLEDCAPEVQDELWQNSKNMLMSAIQYSDMIAAVSAQSLREYTKTDKKNKPGKDGVEKYALITGGADLELAPLLEGKDNLVSTEHGTTVEKLEIPEDTTVEEFKKQKKLEFLKKNMKQDYVRAVAEHIESLLKDKDLKAKLEENVTDQQVEEFKTLWQKKLEILKLVEKINALKSQGRKADIEKIWEDIDSVLKEVEETPYMLNGISLIKDPWVCKVGRLAYQKGFAFIEDEIDQIMHLNGGNFKYFFKGPAIGDEGEKILQKLKEYQKRYPGRIFILPNGDREQAIELYDASNYLEMFSDNEPNGLVIKEAAKRGCVPIISNTGGLKELGKPWDGKKGIFKEDEYSQGLRRLFGGEEYRTDKPKYLASFRVSRKKILEKYKDTKFSPDITVDFDDPKKDDRKRALKNIRNSEMLATLSEALTVKPEDREQIARRNMEVDLSWHKAVEQKFGFYKKLVGLHNENTYRLEEIEELEAQVANGLEWMIIQAKEKVESRAEELEAAERKQRVNNAELTYKPAYRSKILSETEGRIKHILKKYVNSKVDEERFKEVFESFLENSILLGQDEALKESISEDIFEDIFEDIEEQELEDIVSKIDSNNKLDKLINDNIIETLQNCEQEQLRKQLRNMIIQLLESKIKDELKTRAEERIKKNAAKKIKEEAEKVAKDAARRIIQERLKEEIKKFLASAQNQISEQNLKSIIERALEVYEGTFEDQVSKIAQAKLREELKAEKDLPQDVIDEINHEIDTLNLPPHKDLTLQDNKTKGINRDFLRGLSTEVMQEIDKEYFLRSVCEIVSKEKFNYVTDLSRDNLNQDIDKLGQMQQATLQQVENNIHVAQNQQAKNQFRPELLTRIQRVAKEKIYEDVVDIAKNNASGIIKQALKKKIRDMLSQDINIQEIMDANRESISYRAIQLCESIIFNSIASIAQDKLMEALNKEELSKEATEAIKMEIKNLLTQFIESTSSELSENIRKEMQQIYKDAALDDDEVASIRASLKKDKEVQEKKQQKKQRKKDIIREQYPNEEISEEGYKSVEKIEDAVQRVFRKSFAKITDMLATVKLEGVKLDPLDEQGQIDSYVGPIDEVLRQSWDRIQDKIIGEILKDIGEIDNLREGFIRRFIIDQIESQDQERLIRASIQKRLKQPRKLNILFPSVEIDGLKKEGGRANVAAKLPVEFLELGHNVRVQSIVFGDLLPNPDLNRRIHESEPIFEYDVETGENGKTGIREKAHIKARFTKVKLLGKEVYAYLAECDRYYGNRYKFKSATDTSVGPFDDDDERFSVSTNFNIELIERMKSAQEIGERNAISPNSEAYFVPDVIVGNDYETAIIAAMIAAKKSNDPHFERIATANIIHNLAYTREYPSFEKFLQFNQLDKVWEKYAEHDAKKANELYELFEYMYEKAKRDPKDKTTFTALGFLYLDLLVAVSKNYREEILDRSDDQFGVGYWDLMDQIADNIVGITNGSFIEPPSQAAALSKDGFEKFSMDKYGTSRVEWKKVEKRAFRNKFFGGQFANTDNVPIFSVVGRIDPQKGFSTIEATIDQIMQLNNGELQIIIKGPPSDNEETKQRLKLWKSLQEKYKGKVLLLADGDPDDMKQVYAASDFILMPSHFEPCGLGQLEAMKYGGIPIYTMVGGLWSTLKSYDLEADEFFKYLDENGKFDLENLAEELKGIGLGFGIDVKEIKTKVNNTPGLSTEQRKVEIIKKINQALIDIIDNAIKTYKQDSVLKQGETTCKWEKVMQAVMGQDYGWQYTGAINKYIELMTKIVEERERFIKHKYMVVKGPTKFGVFHDPELPKEERKKQERLSPKAEQEFAKYGYKTLDYTVQENKRREWKDANKAALKEEIKDKYKFEFAGDPNVPMILVTGEADSELIELSIHKLMDQFKGRDVHIVVQITNNSYDELGTLRKLEQQYENKIRFLTSYNPEDISKLYAASNMVIFESNVDPKEVLEATEYGNAVVLGAESFLRGAKLKTEVRNSIERQFEKVNDDIALEFFMNQGREKENTDWCNYLKERRLPYLDETEGQKYRLPNAKLNKKLCSEIDSKFKEYSRPQEVREQEARENAEQEKREREKEEQRAIEKIFTNEPPVQADGDIITIRFNYSRYDGNYKESELYSWITEQESRKGHANWIAPFANGVATVQIKRSDLDGKDSLGFLIRKTDKQNWQYERDIDYNRYISVREILAKYNQGQRTINVYVEQKEEEIKIDLPQAQLTKDGKMQLSPKIVWAGVGLDGNTIEFELNGNYGEVTKNSIALMFNGEAIQGNTVRYVLQDTTNKRRYRVGLEKPLEVYAKDNNHKDMLKQLQLHVNTFNDDVKKNVTIKKVVSFEKLFDTPEFNERFNYDGDDLGVTYDMDGRTTFKLWAPTAEKIELVIHKHGIKVEDAGEEPLKIPMQRSDNGTWEFVLGSGVSMNHELQQLINSYDNGAFQANLGKDYYYTYNVMVEGKTNTGVMDPYAKAGGLNAERGKIVDLRETGEVAEKAYNPSFINFNDAQIYEIHTRNFTAHDSSGVDKWKKGHFEGLIQEGTSYKGMPTGIDYIKDRGFTHVQIMPPTDFAFLDDESEGIGNFGYGGRNLFFPKARYVSNKQNRGDGVSSIKALKEVISTYHRKGIGVNIDIEANHMWSICKSAFGQTVPEYFFRKDMNGNLSNAVNCGNETETQRQMMRKYIIDLVCYWAKEYKVDGFRFDVMAIVDKETVRQMSKELKRINPKIMLYGEGWETPTRQTLFAKKERGESQNLKPKEYSNAGFLSWKFSSAVKGDYNDEFYKRFGFLLDGKFSEEHLELIVEALKGEFNPLQPVQSVSSHDNLTTYDKFVRALVDMYGKEADGSTAYEKMQEENMVKEGTLFGKGAWNQVKMQAYKVLRHTPLEKMFKSKRNALIEMFELAYDNLLTMSQAAVMIPEGDDGLRTKNENKGNEHAYHLKGPESELNHDSGMAGDNVNSVDWSRMYKNRKSAERVKAQMRFRSANAALKLKSREQVDKHIRFAKEVTVRSGNTILMYYVKDAKSLNLDRLKEMKDEYEAELNKLNEQKNNAKGKDKARIKKEIARCKKLYKKAKADTEKLAKYETFAVIQNISADEQQIELTDDIRLKNWDTLLDAEKAGKIKRKGNKLVLSARSSVTLGSKKESKHYSATYAGKTEATIRREMQVEKEKQQKRPQVMKQENL